MTPALKAAIRAVCIECYGYSPELEGTLKVPFAVIQNLRNEFSNYLAHEQDNPISLPPTETNHPNPQATPFPKS